MNSQAAGTSPPQRTCGVVAEAFQLLVANPGGLVSPTPSSQSIDAKLSTSVSGRA